MNRTRSGDFASPDLAGELRGRIADRGPLDFAEYMAAALYDPGRGYYARGTHQVGRAGDFFTSVSVGPVFGEILAHRFADWWRGAGGPARWRVTECGAHDGTLAADILESLRQGAPEAYAGVEYATCEPLAALRAAQAEKLAGYGGHVRVAAPEQVAEPLPGVVFGNEVIDALPCRVAEVRSGRWHLLLVGHDAERRFHWVAGEEAGPVPELPDAAHFPDGYRAEFRERAALVAFLAPLLDRLERGLVLWADYGFSRGDLYHPDRVAGTLAGYARHRNVDDLLQNPGEIDLTAHVDFTTLAEVAAGRGARVAAYRSQGSWLIHAARPLLLARDGNPDPVWSRRFQTLVHPGHLGMKFQMLELAWRDPSVPAASAEDLDRLEFRG